MDGSISHGVPSEVVAPTECGVWSRSTLPPNDSGIGVFQFYIAQNGTCKMKNGGKMALPKTNEEKAIEKRTKLWAAKIADTKCKVIFHKLPGRTLAVCYEGWWTLKKYGLRGMQRNVIVFDLEKIKKSKTTTLEEVIIHECTHLKVKTPCHGAKSAAFHAEMKKHLGRFEFDKSS
jgi:hypothetical protein